MIDKKTVDDFTRAMVGDLANSGYLSRKWDGISPEGQRKLTNSVRAGFRAIGVKSEGDPANDASTTGEMHNPVPRNSIPGGTAAAPKGWPAKRSSDDDDGF